MSKRPLEIDMCAGSQLRDTQGETLNVEGADIAEMQAGRGRLNDNHGKGFFNCIGKVTAAKKIFKKEDCEDDRQRYYWEKVKSPYIYVKGELFDDEDHPNARAAAAILRNIHKSDCPLKVKASVEGGVVARGISDSTLLAKTKIHSVALTFVPANQATLVEPLNLDKSADAEADMVLIKSVVHLAQTSVPSFRQIVRDASATKIEQNINKIFELMGDGEEFVELKKALIQESLEAKIAQNIRKINALIKNAMEEIPPELLEEADKDPMLTGFVYPNEARERRPIKHEGQTVGFFTPREENGVLRTGAIYVQPKYRGKGLASNAIREYVGNKPGRALIENGNEASKRAFSAAGFQPTKAAPELDGHWYETGNTLEKKQLDPGLGITFQHEHHDLGGEGDLTHIKAIHPEHGVVGETVLEHQADGMLKPADVNVHPDWRRQGIASAMYAHGQNITGKQIKPSTAQEGDGKALWAGTGGVFKSLSAGYGSTGSPTSMTGGAVLQSESLDSGPKSFRYITCDNCGKEQVYGKFQVKCRECSHAFPMSKLEKFFRTKG